MIPFSLSCWVAIYCMSLNGANVYMYMINGTSKVRLQLIINVIFSLIAIPVMNYCSIHYDAGTILLVPIIVLTLLMIIGKIQITKIVENKATGVWLK